MEPHVAQAIIRDFPQETLEEYVEGRLKAIHLSFETIKPEDLKDLQGRLAEVKLLLTVRKTAQNVLDRARKVPNG